MLNDEFVFQTHLLYLALDNTLQDCSDLPSSDFSDSEIVQDYKKLSKKHAVPLNSNKQRKVPLQPAGPRVLILEENGTNNLEEDVGWDMIAYTKVGGVCFRKVCCVRNCFGAEETNLLICKISNP